MCGCMCDARWAGAQVSPTPCPCSVVSQGCAYMHAHMHICANAYARARALALPVRVCVPHLSCLLCSAHSSHVPCSYVMSAHARAHAALGADMHMCKGACPAPSSRSPGDMLGEMAPVQRCDRPGTSSTKGYAQSLNIHRLHQDPPTSTATHIHTLPSHTEGVKVNVHSGRRGGWLTP